MFTSPSETVHRQGRFSPREVGLTHPDVPSFIRLCDNGDIELIAGEGLGIILSPRSGSITLVADRIKFLTRGENGLRWNKVAFNDRAVAFNEPTFLTVDDLNTPSLYRDVDYYLDDDDDDSTTSVGEAVITDKKGAKIPLSEFMKQFPDVEPIEEEEEFDI